MTEKLIAAIREPFAGDLPEAAGHWRALAILAADALEAATVEPEWEYGVLYPWHSGNAEFTVEYESREEAMKRFSAAEDVLMRRSVTKAGPWLPVGGESE